MKVCIILVSCVPHIPWRNIDFFVDASFVSAINRIYCEQSLTDCVVHDYLYRVAQNHGKQVLRMSCIKFHLPTFQFVVIPHGKRDLSSLPEVGEAAVQIS